MPRVSVILPSYNACSYLAGALNSVIAQTYSDWEIVLVDDGSTDNSRALADEYSRRLSDRLHYIYQPNKGLPAARNTAIRNARGELFALLDADDTWLPDRLIEGVAVMDQDPQVGLVHGRVIRVDIGGGFLDAPEYNPKYLAGHIAHFIYTRRAHIQCPTVLFRRSCVNMVGDFDEKMRSVEDRDLWFRIAERCEVAYIDKVLASYRMSGAGMSADIDRMLKWQLYFVNKHSSNRHLPKGSHAAALASIYRERGDHLFYKRRPFRAIADYSKSVCYNPLSLQNVYMLVRAIVKPF